MHAIVPYFVKYYWIDLKKSSPTGIWTWDLSLHSRLLYHLCYLTTYLWQRGGMGSVNLNSCMTSFMNDSIGHKHSKQTLFILLQGKYVEILFSSGQPLGGQVPDNFLYNSFWNAVGIWILSKGFINTIFLNLSLLVCQINTPGEQTIVFIWSSSNNYFHQAPVTIGFGLIDVSSDIITCRSSERVFVVG